MNNFIEPQPNGEKTSERVIPELYSLWLTVERLCHRGEIFEGVGVSIDALEHDISHYDLDGMFPINEAVSSGAFNNIMCEIQSCFTPEEVIEIESFFQRHSFNGVTFHKSRVEFPFKDLWYWAQVHELRGMRYELDFCNRDGFDCLVKFTATYDQSLFQLVARASVLVCNPNGSLDFDWRGLHQQLSTKEIERIFNLRSEAITKGEKKVLTICLEAIDKSKKDSLFSSYEDCILSSDGEQQVMWEFL